MKKIFTGILICLYILCGISSAYDPHKNEWNCEEIENKEDRAICENEMYFAKFTETTGTRERATTCCSYISHYPIGFDTETNIPVKENKNITKEIVNMKSHSVEQLVRIFLKTFSSIYEQSSNKEQTLKGLSSFLKICSKNSKDEKIKAVCKYFLYDHIGPKPKLSPITIKDLNTTFNKEEKLVKRTMQFSELDENYTPINYHYATNSKMYGIGEYAFGLMDSCDYLNEDHNDFFKILVLKAGDTHRQDFVDITKKPIIDINTVKPKFNEEDLIDINKESIKKPLINMQETKLELKNHKLNLYIPHMQNKNKKNERLTSQFELQKNGKRKLVGCFNDFFSIQLALDYYLISKESLPLKTCKKLNIQVTTTL